MGISDLIAEFIQQSLEDSDGVLELQRIDLAERFHCVPSQINYVMNTRFNPERGYIVESRRGGNGYIRITRVHVDHQTLMMHVINSIDTGIDQKSAIAIIDNLLHAEAISQDAARIIKVVVSDKAYQDVDKDSRDKLRASLLKNTLILLV